MGFMEQKNEAGAIITQKMIDELRVRIKPYLSDKRYAHTISVEKEAAALGEIYMPERVVELRAAALLHDIAKKLTYENQLNLIAEFGIINDTIKEIAPAAIHAVTAPIIIKRDFPEFATSDILSAVRYHTTGRAGMTKFDAIIYLADYIEPTRDKDVCIQTRRLFYEKLKSAGDEKERVVILRETILSVLRSTLAYLTSKKVKIEPDTEAAVRYFSRGGDFT